MLRLLVHQSPRCKPYFAISSSTSSFHYLLGLPHFIIQVEPSVAPFRTNDHWTSFPCGRSIEGVFFTRSSRLISSLLMHWTLDLSLIHIQMCIRDSHIALGPQVGFLRLFLLQDNYNYLTSSMASHIFCILPFHGFQDQPLFNFLYFLLYFFLYSLKAPYDVIIYIRSISVNRPCLLYTSRCV